MTRMKALARSYVWWPSMDAHIEHTVSSQLHQRAPAAAPLHPWENTGIPWTRLHIDYAGSFLGRMFLLVADSDSKWIEAFPMSNSTSTATIEKLRATFATHGIPEIIVSDNGTCFTSSEFKSFMLNNKIRHITSAPYHPSTNGAAEKTVQTFKTAMKK